MRPKKDNKNTNPELSLLQPQGIQYINDFVLNDSRLITSFEFIRQLIDKNRQSSPDIAQELNSILITLIHTQNILGHRIIWDAVEHEKINTLEWFSQNESVSGFLHVLQSPKQSNIAHLAAARGNIKILDWLRTCEWAQDLLTALDSSKRSIALIAAMHQQPDVIKWLANCDPDCRLHITTEERK